MRIGRDGRLAWAIAIAAVAFWAATAPATLGSLLLQEGSGSLSSGPPQETNAAPLPILEQTGAELQCESAPTAAPTSTDDATSEAAPQSDSEGSPGSEAAFRLCGGPDPAAEQAIERFIAGRGFRARLVSRGDSCADLTITVSPRSSAGSFVGRQSTLLTVSAGSTGLISIQIVTENGVTKATINGTAPGSEGGTTEPTPTATPAPTATLAPVPTATPTPSQSAAPGEATFRLCGGPDPGTERAIERLIAGRGFRARLVSREDGCADLTITVSPQSPPASITGRQSTQLTVSAGSAPSGLLSVRIVTENGVTKASIGAQQ
jgi:hypothetical protein